MKKIAKEGKGKSVWRVFYCLNAIAFLLFVNFVAADDHKKEKKPDFGEEVPGGGSSFKAYEESIEQSKTVKLKAFKGFVAYKSRFVKMCKLMEEDGQRVWLHETTKKLVTPTKDCGPCRSLYSTLAATCSAKSKPKPKKKPVVEAKEEEDSSEGEGEEGSEEEGATPTPTPKPEVVKQALDPSTELLDLVSGIFRQMAEDKDFAEENYLAVKTLTDLMKSSADKTSIQRNYLTTLAVYMLSPFESRGIGKKRSQTEKKTGNRQSLQPAVSLDDLF